MVSWQMKWRRRSLLNAQQPEAAEEVERRQDDFQHTVEDAEIAETQSALLLHAIRQPYEFSSNYPIPKVEGDDELLVKVTAVGLNPIDWKAPYVSFIHLFHTFKSTLLLLSRLYHHVLPFISY